MPTSDTASQAEKFTSVIKRKDIGSQNWEPVPFLAPTKQEFEEPKEYVSETPQAFDPLAILKSGGMPLAKEAPKPRPGPVVPGKIEDIDPFKEQRTALERERAEIAELREALSLQQEASRQWEQSLKEREAHLEELKAQVIEQARQEGLELAQEEIEQIKMSLDGAIESFERLDQETMRSIQAGVVDLACSMASKIIGTQAKEHAEFLLATLDKALSQYEIAPAQFRLQVSKSFHAQAKEALLAHGVEVVVDTSLKGIGVVIQHKQGSLDLSLETRWANVVAALGANKPWTNLNQTEINQFETAQATLNFNKPLDSDPAGKSLGRLIVEASVSSTSKAEDSDAL